MSIALLVLTAFKVVGIVLLSIIGLVLLLLLAVLLVPLRYRIVGNVHEDIRVAVKVSWALHLISFQLSLENKELSQSLRICGIPVRLGQKEEEQEDADAGCGNGKGQDQASGEEAQDSQCAGQEAAQRTGDSMAQAKQTASETISDTNDDSNTIGTGQTDADTTDTAQAGVSAIGKSSSDTDTMNTAQTDAADATGKEQSEPIKEKVSFSDRVQGIRDALRRFSEMFRRIREEIRREENRRAVGKAFREIKRLLRHYLPREVGADVTFSTGDPASTGQALGAISLMPFAYGDKVQISPDFQAEKAYVSGDFDIKGHIRAVHVIIMAIRLLMSKDIRNTIKHFRNFKFN